MSADRGSAASEAGNAAWLRRRWWLAAILISFGAALRLHHLDFQSLWTDEISSLRLAVGSAAETLEGLRSDVHPPLYFLILNGWVDLFGYSEVSVRAPSVLAGVLATGFVLPLGVTLFGVRAALLATLFFAASLFQIYYAQEARGYAQLALFSVLSMLCFARGLAREREGGKSRGSLALYVLASAALLYTHYFGVFLLAAQALFLLAAALPRAGGGFVSPPALLRWVLAQAAALLLLLPWLPVFLGQLQHVQRGFWIPPATWDQLVRTPLVFVSLQRPPWGHRPHWDAIGIAMIALGVLGLAVAALASRRRTGAPREALPGDGSDAWQGRSWPSGAAVGLMACWLVVPVLLAWGASVWQSLHVYTFRNVIVSQPATCLLLGALAAWIPSGLLRALFAAAVLACSLGQLPGYYDTPHKGRWRELVDFVGRWERPEDGVAFFTGFVKQSFDFYRMRAEGGPYRFVDLREARPRKEPRIWLVKAHARGHNFRDVLHSLRIWGYEHQQTWRFAQAELMLFSRAPPATRQAPER